MRHTALYAVAATCLLAACGSVPPQEASDSRTPSPTASTAPTKAPAVIPKLPPAIGHNWCEPSGSLAATHLFSATGVKLLPDTASLPNAAEMQSFYRLQLDNSKMVARRPDQPSTEVMLPDDVMMIGASRPAFDDQVLAELLATDGPVLVMGNTMTDKNFIAIAAATLGADGSFELLGDCGRRLDKLIKQAAAEMGVPADASFLAKAGSTETPEGQRVYDLVIGESRIEAPVWQDQAPDQRSLFLSDIPLEFRSQFSLVGLYVQVDSGVPEGVIEMSTSQGQLNGFATSGQIDGPLGAMISPEVDVVDVYFKPSSDGGRTLVASVPARQFDPYLGSQMTVSTDGKAVSAAVAPLAPGELEKRLGMTREQVEAYRKQLLETP
jgi:hypothetical protein